MPRQLRIEYEGAIYHVLNRGDRREPIFKEDQDRELFLATLGEVCAKTSWQVHAYCLMGNHFHLILETPSANLVAGMKWFLGTYTNRFNRRHSLVGHLFSGRYKSLIVDGSQDGYLRTVCEYVHLNPVRAKLIKLEQPLRSYRWSSFGEYLLLPSRRVPWLRVDRLFGEMRIPLDSKAGREEFERQMEVRRQAESGTDWKNIRRGWLLGNEEFRKELLVQVHKRSGEYHYALPRRESAEVKAETLVCEELQRRGWTEASLAQARKGDPQKVEIACRLRNETTVTLKWIAERLEMGAWAHAANCIYKSIPGRTVNRDMRAIKRLSPTNQRGPMTIEGAEESIVRTDPFVLPVHCL